jgi:hypothetical protein
LTNMADKARPCLAVFRQDGGILAQHSFRRDVIGGAAFSPGGNQGVTVSVDPTGFSASYLETIERFDSHHQFQYPVNIKDGLTTATNRWHVLFSPDDTLVMVSAVSVGAPGRMTIRIHDLVRKKDLGPALQARCTAGDLQGEVTNGNTVVIKLDGSELGAFPIQ